MVNIAITAIEKIITIARKILVFRLKLGTMRHKIFIVAIMIAAFLALSFNSSIFSPEYIKRNIQRMKIAHTNNLWNKIM